MLKAIVLFIVAVLPIFVLTTEEQGKACPCANTKEINKVCASDNVTYINPGEVKCVNECKGKNLEIVDNKPCPCICANTRERYLVCADDDNTYVNPGAVRCHNKCNYHQIKIVNYKPCREGDNGLSH